ncbi:MAG: hypothetical protein LBC96_09330 [Lachnospiraceae bacterium]|jgi:type VII secretion protein EssB|nr:hypothetical protein [Lachnospiraceae bacterium]
MNNKLSKEVRLFDLTSKDSQLYRLSYQNRWLVPVDITSTEETAIFSFDITGLTPLTELYNHPQADQLRFLLNVSELICLTHQYDFSLSPENIFFNYNYEPRILMRDMTKEDNPRDFVKEYKALTATLLVQRYCYDDYLNSGHGLYKKSRCIKELWDTDTVIDIHEHIKQQFLHEEELTRTRKILVNRHQRRFLLIATPFSFILFLMLAFFSFYLYFFMFTHNTTLLLANREFLRENYDVAIDLLLPIEPMNMEREERYQLARAYIISESLSPEQRAHILSGITLMTDDNILIYWISLGRMDYDTAIDIAMRVGDDELQLYALVKYETSVQIDTTRSGDEKVQLLADLNRQIENLRRSLNEKRETRE